MWCIRKVTRSRCCTAVSTRVRCSCSSADNRIGKWWPNGEVLSVTSSKKKCEVKVVLSTHPLDERTDTFTKDELELVKPA
jgi:hypothetical protein